MGWVILIVCVFIALGMYSCCVVAKQAEEAAEEMRLKRLLLDSERLTDAAIASDVGRRRGFQDGYEACRDELAEKMMERIEEDGTLVIGVKDATKVTRVLVDDDKKNGDLYYADRPKGEWRDDGFAHRCSNCGKTGVGIESFDFCPYCGADMRGEDNE